MTRTSIAAWVSVIALAVGGAPAETFHTKDGVVFEGTIRQVVTNAAVCNVLVENHTEEQYERLKANQDRPLHLWQVDFSVRNESGRPLDYLHASGWVLSEWPPCTNWSGEGPGGGPLQPESSLPIGMVWTDHYEVVQMPYGMRLDQQERRSKYLIVFDGQQPRFGEWNINYRFAAGSGGATQSGREPQAPALAFELPPEIQADRYLRLAEQAVRSGDAAGARAAMERLASLQQEQGLEPAPEDHYRYAQAWAAAGEPQRAKAAAVRYLQLQGRKAEHYTEALDLMNRAEFGRAGKPQMGSTHAEAGQPSRPKPEPSCTGMPQGSECWMELSNHPACYVWIDRMSDVEPASWSGECRNGLAQGAGTFAWKQDDDSSGRTGFMVDGKRHGQWTLRRPNGDVFEGPYVDGERHGQWVFRQSNGLVVEGPYVDGKQRGGQFVYRFPNGDVHEGPMVDGERHGQWTLRYYATGITETVTYVRDKAQ